MDHELGGSYYLELPLLFSLKFSVLRLNGGIYYGYYTGTHDDIFLNDFGLSTGIGFDIGMFYIGAFYDHGLINVSAISGYNFYHRTLGFNVGVNL